MYYGFREYVSVAQKQEKAAKLVEKLVQTCCGLQGGNGSHVLGQKLVPEP